SGSAAGSSGSLFRIHRDTRFSNDKTPYKTWQGARLFHERHRQVPAPSLYLPLQPGNGLFAGGIWHPELPVPRRGRQLILDDLRHRNFVAWRPLEGATMTGPRLLSILAKDLQAMAPFMDYLCAALDLEF